MSNITGTVAVTGMITPGSTDDDFPVIDPKYGIGGYREVADTTERDAIPAPRKREGMLVYVAAEQKVYRLGSDLETWTEFSSGGGSGDYTFQDFEADMASFLESPGIWLGDLTNVDTDFATKFTTNLNNWLMDGGISDISISHTQVNDFDTQVNIDIDAWINSPASSAIVIGSSQVNDFIGAVDSEILNYLSGPGSSAISIGSSQINDFTWAVDNEISSWMNNGLNLQNVFLPASNITGLADPNDVLITNIVNAQNSWSIEYGTASAGDYSQIYQNLNNYVNFCILGFVDNLGYMDGVIANLVNYNYESTADALTNFNNNGIANVITSAHYDWNRYYGGAYPEDFSQAFQKLNNYVNYAINNLIAQNGIDYTYLNGFVDNAPGMYQYVYDIVSGNITNYENLDGTISFVQQNGNTYSMAVNADAVAELITPNKLARDWVAYQGNSFALDFVHDFMETGASEPGYALDFSITGFSNYGFGKTCMLVIHSNNAADTFSYPGNVYSSGFGFIAGVTNDVFFTCVPNNGDGNFVRMTISPRI